MEKTEDKFNTGETVYLDKNGKPISEKKYRELQGLESNVKTPKDDLKEVKDAID